MRLLGFTMGGWIRGERVRDAAAVPALREVAGSGPRRWVRFVRANRLYTPRYWALGLRYLWRFKIRNRHVVTHGMVFVARGAEVTCRRGLGHLELGRWVWIGRGNAIRCHEGFLRIGDKTVFGSNVTVDGYLDVDFGAECLRRMRDGRPLIALIDKQKGY